MLRQTRFFYHDIAQMLPLKFRGVVRHGSSTTVAWWSSPFEAEGDPPRFEKYNFKG